MESQADMQIAVVYHGRRLLADSTNTTVTFNGTTTTADPKVYCESVLYEYDIPTAVVCALCFVLGVIYTFFGYRIFKAMAFFTGFIFGAMLVFLVCQDVEGITLPPAGMIGIALGAGLVCGIITLLVKYISLFMTGLHFGLGLAVYVIVFLEFVVYHSRHLAIPLTILGVVGLVCALLALKYQKCLALLGTSMLGSALMVGALDYYIEKFVTVRVLWTLVRAHDLDGEMCWYSWAIFACWPFCLIIGAFIQWRVTGHNLDHSSVVHGSRIRKVDLIKLRAALYHDTQGLRYRDLYQARRIKGDQILQRYVLNITDNSNTLSSSQKSEGAIPDSANTTMTQLP
ncbi:transmembrane protein 198-B-like [Liolophura sinensis]|uniref:transmembrane protein 198-B-like n=1 Tax=Liolophura sinensis TaxID=3198878 RepID=UPI00315964D6